MVNRPGVETSFYRLSLTGSYVLNDNLSFGVSIPYIDAERREAGLPSESINGLGDISSYFQWSCSSADCWMKGLGVNVGLIVPTGNASDQPFTGNANPEVFQLGTGALQLIVGVSYQWEAQDWAFLINASTVQPLNESDIGFRPSSSYYGSISATRSINDKLSGLIGLDLTYSDDDELNGNALITRYTTLAIKTGLYWQLDDRHRISSSVSLPVYRNVRDTQIGTGTLFQLGLSRGF